MHFEILAWRVSVIVFDIGPAAGVIKVCESCTKCESEATLATSIFICLGKFASQAYAWGDAMLG